MVGTVMEPQIFDYIENDNTVLEKETLEQVVNMGQLVAFKHDGFWQCMDTPRDRELLEKLVSNHRNWFF